MKELIHYFFTDPVASKVLVGVIMIGLVSGLIGTFAFLRKKTLIGDAISHAVFPGVCIGFLFAGTKDPIFLILGAIVTGWISVLFIDFLSNRTKLKEDTAIALVSTFFFGIGSVIYSFITSQNGGNESGLKVFLFGKAATMTTNDVQLFVGVSIVIILLVLIFQKHLLLLTFNKDFAQSIGVSVKLIELLLSSMLVITVSLGIQVVGVVLMSALLISPAAIARYWTNSMRKMQILASIMGVISGIVGVVVSSLYSNMPTGPWIVSVLFFFAILTFIFAPKKGWLSQRYVQRRNKAKINTENLLKLIYQLKESGKGQFKYMDLLEKREMDTLLVSKYLKIFVKNDWLEVFGTTYSLTDKGVEAGARVVRLHRLWELYLTNRLNFKEDHIHGAAETVEHLITPELEEELMRELGYPEIDPHNKLIPYNKK
jgi:manganese/zinc/iron transport system permease protein